MQIHCPNCKIASPRKYSKRIYFIKAAVCLAVIVLCYFEFNSLYKEKDVDPPILVGLLVSPIMALASFIFGGIFFIKGLLIKNSFYKCRYCKHSFTDGFLSEEVEGEDLLKAIRKKN
jgi:hypothetical protein